MSEEKELRILILEDAPTDVELMERELCKGGLVFSSQRVETEQSFTKALAEFRPEVILADYTLPAFDGLSALAIVREKCPDIPFVFVTGSMGEERAIEAIKQGATDYVLKERLSKLEPAVRRALLEAEEHRRRMAAEEEVRTRTRQIAESEAKLRLIFEGSPDAMVVISEDNTVLSVNPAAERLFDRTNAEIVGAEFGFPVVGNETCEIEVLSMNGQLRTAEMYLSDIEWDGEKAFLISIRDITERKKAEEDLRQRIEELERFRNATTQREFRIKELKDRVKVLEAEIGLLRQAPQPGEGQ